MSLLFLTYSDENNENVFMQAINRSSQVDTFCVFKGGANRFQRMFRRFSVETEQSFLHYWFSNAWFNNLDAYDTVVITASLYTPSILHWLHKRYPEKRLINYYWDQVSVSHYPVEQSSDFENWSFDEEDCEKYKMRYNPQFYSKFIDVKGSVVSNDISSYVVSGDDVVSENRDDNSRYKRERDEREHKCGLVECPDGDRQD